MAQKGREQVNEIECLVRRPLSALWISNMDYKIYVNVVLRTPMYAYCISIRLYISTLLTLRLLLSTFRREKAGLERLMCVSWHVQKGTICTICRNCLRYPPDCPEDLCQCYKAESPTRAAPARIQDELSAGENNSLGKGKLSSLAALLFHGQHPVYPNAPVYSVIVAK